MDLTVRNITSSVRNFLEDAGLDDIKMEISNTRLKPGSEFVTSLRLEIDFTLMTNWSMDPNLYCSTAKPLVGWLATHLRLPNVMITNLDPLKIDDGLYGKFCNCYGNTNAHKDSYKGRFEIKIWVENHTLNRKPQWV